MVILVCLLGFGISLGFGFFLLRHDEILRITWNSVSKDREPTIGQQGCRMGVASEKTARVTPEAGRGIIEFIAPESRGTATRDEHLG